MFNSKKIFAKFLAIISIIIFCFMANLSFSQNIQKRSWDFMFSNSVEELKRACRIRGLSDSGSLYELKLRLLKYISNKNRGLFIKDINNLKRGTLFLRHADYMTVYKEQNNDEIIVLFGSVSMEYLGKKIRANIIRLNNTKGILIGTGNIIYDDGQRIYNASRIYFNEKNNKGIFYNAQTELGNFIYKGKSIRKLKDEDKYIGDDISLTTCRLEYPHYLVKADKLYYFDSRLVLIKNMKLYFGEDDLVEVPYFFKNLEESNFKTAVFFRERSGIVIQNTYYPIKNNNEELKLMGDYYERLGLYSGVLWEKNDSKYKININASGALSNDLYYYNNITENWSPLIPSNNSYRVSREFRYKLKSYYYREWIDGFKNKFEFNWLWMRDPYYEYDFERRYETFNISKLVGEAEKDYPAKGGIINWGIKDNFTWDNFNANINNKVSFIPQRNLNEDITYFTDYYRYTLYSAVVPSLSFGYVNNLLNDNIGFLSGSKYTINLDYNNFYYFDEKGKLLKHYHNINSAAGIENDYSVSNYFTFNPYLGIGISIKKHVNPDLTDIQDDNKNTMFYGRFENSIKFGTDIYYLNSRYRIKYKFAGPDDNYLYGNFRIHDFNIGLYLNTGILFNSITTSIDLKPVYDWKTGRYSYKIDKEKFFPLIDVFKYSPIDYLSFENKLVYSISDARFTINSFLFNFNSEDISPLNKVISISWVINWEHNFINPEVDFITSSFFLQTNFIPLVNVYIGFYSRNDEIWKYISSRAKLYGIKPINPIVDLLKSFNFFNINDRKESNFKLKAVSFGLTHDLHEWELKIDYTGKRELSYNKERYIWNNIYSISIGLKNIKDVIFNPKFSNTR